MDKEEFLAIFRSELVVADGTVGSGKVRTVGEDVGWIGLVVDLGGCFEDFGIVGSKSGVGDEIEKGCGAGCSSEG